MLLHDLVVLSADRAPENVCLRLQDQSITYREFLALVERIAAGLRRLGIARNDRVAVYLPKTIEAVATMFAASVAGGVFVAVNPLLKGAQVSHILNDCEVSIVVTTKKRADTLGACKTVRHTVTTDAGELDRSSRDVGTVPWSELAADHSERPLASGIDVNMAAIFYTSGSSGRPKGVVVSHRNLVTGARSVSQYLGNTSSDRLLAVLPFSFDYGFNQLACAFLVGASVYLLDYVLPREVLSVLLKHEITGMAGVPTLWTNLANLEWDPEIAKHLRYITNSGGAMPVVVLSRLRKMLPRTRMFLMYGLTEAFRSTYLDPDQVERRPTSIGKAIPNAEVLVVGPDGSPCGANVPGELVHRGSLVAMGYWNDKELTARRFRPAPGATNELPFPEIAVWSGDTVKMDEEGFLYFIGRNDELIKTSGYRVSPTEIEAVVLETRLAAQAVAVGVQHPGLGQAIAVAVQPPPGGTPNTDALLEECRRRLPSYMLPTYVDWRDEFPVNPNGKCDRLALARDLRGRYEAPA